MDIGDLPGAIQSWDQKSSSDIQDVYQSFCGLADFSDALLSLLAVENCQRGATWLLKHYLEQGGILSEAEVMAFYQRFDDLAQWEARLHCLQSMPYLPLPENARSQLELFIRENLVDENKFVRAWSYNGFYLLARSFPDLRKEAEEFFDLAMRDEAASVKARIRNILKQGW